MSIDFSTLQSLTIPEGVVTEIKDVSGRVLWSAVNWPDDLDTGLEFVSANPFSMSVPKVGWDGTMEYCNSDEGWKIWSGEEIFSGSYKGLQRIYVRGLRGTVVTGVNSSDYKWVLNGIDIKCNGNIAKLLSYSTVKNGRQPSTNSYCYSYMFYGCTSLTTAPSLPATTLSNYCYAYMFYGCTSLKTAPSLPAKTLRDYCYTYMFYGCTSLTTAPSLPATTLKLYCYSNMFNRCTSLTTAPNLPATTLSNYCYEGMFNSCTSLKTAPILPATTLAGGCYTYMFNNCTSLTTAPSLPATTVKASCYRYMFRYCTSLTTAPSLPATALNSYCYAYMFSNCTALTSVPSLPATALRDYCYDAMFDKCTNIRVSSALSGSYTTEYRIPYSGDGTTMTHSIRNMFRDTGGTFTGTPDINTTYYLDASNTIV